MGFACGRRLRRQLIPDMSDVDFLLDIIVPPDREERVRVNLYLAGSAGDYEHDGVLTAFFERREDRDLAAKVLQSLELEAEPRDSPRENWLDRYQQSLHAIPIGGRFIVTPDPDLVPNPGDRIVLHIPQERAFGTGAHESTALCLAMLERIDLRGTTTVDIGTGSGVLAIAMLKLGARKAIAFDNDPETSGVIHRNARRNGIERASLEAFVGSPEAVRGLRAQVITMNILPEVIIPLLPSVSRWLRPGGSLIVSGILLMKRDDVVAAGARESLRIANEAVQGEWWCGVLTGP